LSYNSVKMSNNVNIRKLVGGLTKYNYSKQVGGLAFRSKVKQALEGSGFEKVRAGKIATGIRSGNLNLSRTQSLRVIKALKKGELIKSNVRDLRGSINSYIKAQTKGADSEEVKKQRIEILNRLRRKEEDDRPDIDEILGHNQQAEAPQPKVKPVSQPAIARLDQEPEAEDLPLD